MAFEVGGGEEVGVAAVLEFEFLRSWATVRGKLRTAMLACVRPANSCFSSFLFMVTMDSMTNDLLWEIGNRFGRHEQVAIRADVMHGEALFENIKASGLHD